MNDLVDFYFSNIIHVVEHAIQSPSGLHPLLIHFPIALLYIAPLFIIIGCLLKDLRRPFFWSSLVLIIIGTFSLWLSLITGEMAAEALTNIPEKALETLSYHDELAHVSRNIFIVLSIIFSLYVANFRALFFQLRRRWHNLFLVAFLTVYCAGLIVLTNTAHYGGELVHQHHIRSTIFNNNVISTKP